VQQAISVLASHGFSEMEEVVVADENVTFIPPRQLNSSVVPAHAVRSVAP
jgi:hypothetical protein